MKYEDTTNKVKGKEQSKLINSKNQLKNIKSKFILKKILSYMTERKTLEVIKYSKSIQKRISKDVNNYKDYSEKYSSIELDIIPVKGEYGKFIDIKKEDKKYFHIYFNDNKKKEIKNTYLDEDENVSKISIIIDYHIKSFSELFL